MPGPGRPRKDPEEEDCVEHKRRVDSEEKEFAALRKKSLDTWFEMNGPKLIQCRKNGFGNVYSRFVGHTKKQAVKDYVKILKKKGVLRDRDDRVPEGK